MESHLAKPNTHLACVVIPIYQARLSPSEQLALDRCMEVLGNHPIAIVKPESLHLEQIFNRYRMILPESFRDEFFTDVRAYNRMMLSDEFYARFAPFEFILVYQLDSFLFSDQLMDWCSREYDYIGAPWLPPGRMPSGFLYTLIAARRKLHRLLNWRARSKDHVSKPQFAYSTGNGGFSLRRVSAMRRVLANLSRRAERYRLGRARSWHEDIFFSVEANRYCTHIRLPSVRESVYFSWETNPAAASQLTQGVLPFGCHGWNKLHRDEWRPIFASLGYAIDSLLPR